MILIRFLVCLVFIFAISSKNQIESFKLLKKTAKDDKKGENRDDDSGYETGEEKDDEEDEQEGQQSQLGPIPSQNGPVGDSGPTGDGGGGGGGSELGPPPSGNGGGGSRFGSAEPNSPTPFKNKPSKNKDKIGGPADSSQFKAKKGGNSNNKANKIGKSGKMSQKPVKFKPNKLNSQTKHGKERFKPVSNTKYANSNNKMTNRFKGRSSSFGSGGNSQAKKPQSSSYGLASSRGKKASLVGYKKPG